ncbi:MAG: hypothetical protein U0531_15435 [Dehalococcoidia bacterium]
MEEAHDKGENFAIYKVYSTHQAAHLEFESPLFQLRLAGAGGRGGPAGGSG